MLLVKTFGAPLHRPAPDTTGFPYNGLDVPVTVFQRQSGAPNATAPADGVIVRWRARATFGAGLSLLVMRPSDGGTFVEAARSPYGTYLGNSPIQSIDDRLSVRAGDRLGLATGGQIPTMGALGALAAMGDGERLGMLEPSEGTALDGYRLLVQADIEPDADKDGYGDVSQDECPGDSTRHAGCTADLRLTSWSKPVFRDRDHTVYFEFDLVNEGPDPAYGVVVRFTPPADGEVWKNCLTLGDGRLECRFDRVDPGLDGSKMIQFFIEPPHAVDGLSMTMSTAARTPDPDLSNNALTLTAGPSTDTPIWPPPMATHRAVRRRPRRSPSRAPRHSGARVGPTRCAGPPAASVSSASAARTSSTAWAATTACRAAPATICWTAATATTS